ncbi:MAG: hypothetical protein WBM62_15785 [Crocosphaera sp.]
MLKQPVCPIGLECIEHKDFYRCPNYSYCINQSYSWSIPYEYENSILTVKSFGYRYQWRKEATGISHKLPPQCTLPSGSYKEIEENHWERQEIRQRILEEWEKAGWKAAEEIPNLNNDNDDDIDIDDIF